MWKRKLWWLVVVAVAVACTSGWSDEIPTEEAYVLPADFPDQAGFTTVVVAPG